MSGRLVARQRVPEVMDDPQLDRHQHRAALRGLSRLNRASGSVRLVWEPLRSFAPGGPLRVLDVATGAGDLPLGLWKRARRAGWSWQVDGCDVSRRAVAVARQAAHRADAPARFFRHDALEGELPASYDVVTCSLFLHHLSEADAVSLLARMARAARSLVVVSDLQRSTPGWWLAFAASRLLARSPVVRVDALRSVAAAYQLEEVSRLAAEAGLRDAVVKPRWPYRWTLVWRKDAP